MTTDAIVVGSGPGGSSVADVLTSAGWSIVIFEKGRNHLLDPGDLSRPAGDYSNDEIKFLHRHFLGPDPFLEPHTFRASDEDGDHTHVGSINAIPSTVGGGGVHADGKVPRFREEDFRLLSSFGPQEGAAVADWPLTYDELEPYYARVEESIGVAGLDGSNPFAAPRSGPFPMPPGADMYGATLSVAAAERLGCHPYPAPTAANSVPYGGRPACNNCGFCAFFGCPIHAKGDPVAMLTRVMATGRAELLPETFVSRVNITKGRATGVEYIGPDGVSRTRTARYVFLACGAVETPRLLLLSGIEHDLIGRHLMVHFQTIAAGGFAIDLHPERGRSVTHLHDDYIVGDLDMEAAAREAGLPWMRGGTVEHTGQAHITMEARLYGWGSSHPQAMRDSPLRRRLWALVMQGEDLPYPTNRVDLDPAVRDVRGYPVARLTYRPGIHEMAVSRHVGPRMEAILTEMGAKWTAVHTSPGVDYRGGSDTPVPDSHHVMGTVRMGGDPATSVVDRWGAFHDIPNLVVADSSVFPTSTGYGPTLTLVALAARAADHVAGGSISARPLISAAGENLVAASANARSALAAPVRRTSQQENLNGEWCG